MCPHNRPLVAVIALATAACTTGVGRRTAPPPTSAPARLATAPTTTLRRARVDPPPPPLVDTGTDYARIMRSLLEFENWMDEYRPDRRLVASVAAAGSPNEQALTRDLERYRTRGLRFRETYAGPSRVTIVSVADHVVSGWYTQPITRQAVLDTNGRVVTEHVPASPTTTYIVVMVLDGGRWRLASVRERL